MGLRLVWATAAAGTVSWLTLIALFDRYAEHSRYSGLGAVFLVASAVVPATSLSFAVMSQFWRSARRAASVVAIGAGALPVLALGWTVLDGELRLAEERARQSEAKERHERIRSELSGLDLRELATLATEDEPAGIRDDVALWLAFDRLRQETRECTARPEVATYAMKQLALGSEVAVPSLGAIAREACPALREPLRGALVDGVVARSDAARDHDLVVRLVEVDGALLEEVHARVHFEGEATRKALEELIASRSAEAYAHARRVLELGLNPSSGEPLSATLREVCSERNPAWPEGATPDERALFDALIAAERSSSPRAP